MRVLSSLYSHFSSFQGRQLTTNFSLIFALGCLLCAGAPIHALPATTVTLTVTSGSGAVTTVSSGSVVTLTATVMAGTTPVKPGQVEFCDAAAAHCTDIHLLATAQLIAAGTATYKFRPGGGSHSYKAVFKGTTVYAASSSTASALSVTGPFPTVTSLSQTANAGSWTLTARVAGGVSTPGMDPPSGTVSFLDTGNAATVLATAELATGTAIIDFSNSYNAPVYGGDPNYPDSMTVADFNGDGNLDLAVTDGGAGLVHILLGNGDGTFAIKGSIASGANSIAAADFNGDGIPDLVAGGTILIGNGDGTFTKIAAGGEWLVFVAVGDFNGDGLEDVALAGGTTVTILLGNGDGTFTPSATSPTIDYFPLSIAVGDFNGDGTADLAIGNYDNYNLTILLGNGDGTFDPNRDQTSGRLTEPSVHCGRGL